MVATGRGQGETPGDANRPVREISVAGALEMARSGNYDLRIAEYDHDRAGADFRRSARVFLPQVNLSETVVSTDDPLMAFGLKLKQESVTPADFNPAILNDPARISNFTTKIEVLQPVLNLDGFFGRHAASRAEDAARSRLVRTGFAVEYGVKSAYFGLVLANRSLSVVNEAVAAATAYRDQARNFREAGMIQESDYLMAEMRLVELEMKKIEAENGIRDAEDHLRVALGISGDIRLVPTDTLEFMDVADVAVDPLRIHADRSDMKAMQYGIDAASAGVRMQRASFLPSVNAFASYELNNDALVGTMGRSWMVGAVLRWNIFAGFDRIGELQKASATLSSLETEFEKMKANSDRELASARRSLESAAKGVELASSAVTQAAEALRVRSDRYEQGLERTADLLQAEAAYANARLTQLNSLYRHATSVFLLEFLLERKVTR